MLLRLLFVMTAASVLCFAACRVCSPVSARREPGCCVETAPDEEDTRPNVRFVTKNDCAVIAMRAQPGIAIMPEPLPEGRRDGIAALEPNP